MKKPGYTITQHEELGALLARLRDALVGESVKLSNAYPLREKAPQALRAALDSLDKARSSLDDLICRENPQVDNSILKAYYPLRETRHPSQA